MNFDIFFRACGAHDPRPYQSALATSDWPETLIIPTGFGKTAAVLAAWIWKIGHRKDPATPRRLICYFGEHVAFDVKNWHDTDGYGG